MIFKHDFIKFKELEAEITDKGRIYSTPDGKRYPSVTTVLGIQDNPGLDAWRLRVSDKEADHITRQAANGGQIVHDLAEQYILNKNIDFKKQMPINLMMFNQIKKIITENVDNIRGAEVPLYSHFLQTAGRVDLIADWQGRLAIIDYKTSRNEKPEEWIEGYRMQMAAYSVMFEEMTGIPVSLNVIVMAVKAGQGTVFISKRDDWIGKFQELREQYRCKYEL